MRYDDLEGWDGGGGREAQEGGDMGTCVCTWLIRFVEPQKLTQCCEAVEEKPPLDTAISLAISYSFSLSVEKVGMP